MLKHNHKIQNLSFENIKKFQLYIKKHHVHNLYLFYLQSSLMYN